MRRKKRSAELKGGAKGSIFDSCWKTTLFEIEECISYTETRSYKTFVSALSLLYISSFSRTHNFPSTYTNPYIHYEAYTGTTQYIYITSKSDLLSHSSCTLHTTTNVPSNLTGLQHRSGYKLFHLCSLSALLSITETRPEYIGSSIFYTYQTFRFHLNSPDDRVSPFTRRAYCEYLKGT